MKRKRVIPSVYYAVYRENIVEYNTHFMFMSNPGLFFVVFVGVGWGSYAVTIIRFNIIVVVVSHLYLNTTYIQQSNKNTIHTLSKI